MVSTKDITNDIIYIQLKEIIKRMSKQEIKKIPQNIITNIQNKPTKNDQWKYNDNKSLQEQDILPQTKAIIIQIYKKYLCKNEEKEFWEKYDRICFNMIEEEKKKKYNPHNIFNNEKINKTQSQNHNTSIIEYKENIFMRIIRRIKEIIYHRTK